MTKRFIRKCEKYAEEHPVNSGGDEADEGDGDEADGDNVDDAEEEE